MQSSSTAGEHKESAPNLLSGTITQIAVFVTNGLHPCDTTITVISSATMMAIVAIQEKSVKKK
jgi:hypothetical protein